jgi:hypothetical protein
MNIDQVIHEVEVLAGRLSRADLIDSQGTAVLERVNASLRSAKKRRGRAWECSIEKDNSLTFRETEAREVKYRMKVDLFGQLSQPENGIPSGAHALAVRVWCLDKSVWFNERVDAPSLEKEIQTGRGERVMLRFRFDYAAPRPGEQAKESRFHLQIGGQQGADEFYRMPDNLGVPRFIHYPMNLVMACEFVVCHFYRSEYVALSKEPSLVSVLRRAEQVYLVPFIDRVKLYKPGSGQSFLKHMWDYSDCRPVET